MDFESWQRRMETWISDQRSRVPRLPSLPRGAQWQWQWPVKLKWPPWEDDRQQRKKLQEEYERRKKHLHELCRATKVETVADLQDILCSMVLSECVYKRPVSELVRAVNKFKVDFGGQVVSLERVQPSLDHVSHRYLLAEAGDTLFASFIGTKQYKDVMADFNIFQGAIFHEDALDDFEESETAESDLAERREGNEGSVPRTLEAKPKQVRQKLKPAAHRGFMARAKGIPALELYRLAQKKKRKLVLCGHSLGGAVAALATLAILSGVAQSSSKQNEKLEVKCITFSQPPVGNAELRDLVVKKGWQHYFKTYCIPEDLVPRILSPAYFHHYNTHAHSSPADGVNTSLSVLEKEEAELKRMEDSGEENEGKQLVFGVGPVQTSFWRLSRLVPLEGVKQRLAIFRQNQVSKAASSLPISAITTSSGDVVEPQSLEIQGTDRVSLNPISDSNKGALDSETAGKARGKGGRNNGNNEAWPRVPYLPFYVPFGELYILGTSSVELLSDSEYSKLTSVKSVIAELREKLQSHSMKSYRARFQRIYDLCTSDSNLPFLGVEQLQQFPHLQQWLGMSVAGTVELGHIVDSLSIHTATSIVPLGWRGSPGEKGSEPLKVDLTGFGLHLCTLVQAQVNGNWCSTTLESFPTTPPYSSDELQPQLQKMRILIGAPLRHPPKHLVAADSLRIMFPSIDSDLKRDQFVGALSEGKFIRPAGLNSFVVYCTSDFTTVSRTVDMRTRRVRLVGLEGAGKTTLLKAILNQSKNGDLIGGEDPLPEPEVEEGIAGGVCYTDSKGVNLQELKLEASRFRDELWTGIRDLGKKIDLIVLVHNLSHKIPRQSNSNASDNLPALALILDEAKALGVPWILAVTNKFSVSAHQQKAAIDSVLQAYQASPSSTRVINSCPYTIYVSGNDLFPVNQVVDEMDGKNIILGPLSFVLRSFQRNSSVLPVEGLNSLSQLVHNVLQRHEESAFEEFARDRVIRETARHRAKEGDAEKEAREKANSFSAAAVGASLGAGLGAVLAVVMGAASALRKP